MLTSHELIGFMPQPLAHEMLEFLNSSDRTLYKTIVTSVADSRKFRPVFVERMPKAERHQMMVSALARPGLDLVAGNLLRAWLLQKQTAVVTAFLDALAIPHKDGVVDDLPKVVDAAKLTAAVDALLAAHPREVVTIYLHAFAAMNDAEWEPLKQMLQEDKRLQL